MSHLSMILSSLFMMAMLLFIGIYVLLIGLMDGGHREPGAILAVSAQHDGKEFAGVVCSGADVELACDPCPFAVAACHHLSDAIGAA